MNKTYYTLLLNNDYRPLSVKDSRKIFKLEYKYLHSHKPVLTVVDYYDGEYFHDSKGREHPIPCVAALTKHVRLKDAVPFNRKNIYLRDEMKCQYCAKKLTVEEITYDHVISRAKWDQEKNGTPTFWENIVVCCRPCNLKKGSKSLEEAGMSLIKKPVKPEQGQNVFYDNILGLAPWSNIHPKWVPFLPQAYIEYRKKIYEKAT